MSNNKLDIYLRKYNTVYIFIVNKTLIRFREIDYT